jgi:hypothetical protein
MLRVVGRRSALCPDGGRELPSFLDKSVPLLDPVTGMTQRRTLLHESGGVPADLESLSDQPRGRASDKSSKRR